MEKTYQITYSTVPLTQANLDFIASYYRYNAEIDGDEFEFVQQKAKADIDMRVIAPMLARLAAFNAPVVDISAQATAFGVVNGEIK